jgi:hypothetical protein
MYCLTHTADTMEYSLGFSRDDETSWGVYDTWGELCGAVTAQFDAAKCYLCGSKSYPLIHQECSHEERRLSGHVWTLFDSFKEERRRRLQKDFDDVPKDPNVRNGGLKKDPIVGNRGPGYVPLQKFGNWIPLTAGHFLFGSGGAFAGPYRS